MFFLQNRTLLGQTADSRRRAADITAYTRQLLADSAEGLCFNPENHTYFIGDIRIPCVSDIVEWFAPFDSEAMAERCSKNPAHKLFGKTIEEILSIWKEKGTQAAEMGTQVHEFGEVCFHYVRGETEQIPSEYRDRLTDTGLIAVTPKEEAIARWWEALNMERFIPIAKETKIINPVLHYAGTFDLLLYDLAKQCFVLKDYKTNEELFRSYGNKLRAPLSIIDASSHGKYTLQQNLYRIQLLNIGINVEAMELIWLKEDGTFEEVNIPDYETLVRYAISTNQNSIINT